jgi:hypothetical protein
MRFVHCSVGAVFATLFTEAQTRRLTRPSFAVDAGEVMGKKPRIALLLAATSCLMAVMVDWITQQLYRTSNHAEIPAAITPESVSVTPE